MTVVTPITMTKLATVLLKTTSDNATQWSYPLQTWLPILTLTTGGLKAVNLHNYLVLVAMTLWQHCGILRQSFWEIEKGLVKRQQCHEGPLLNILTLRKERGWTFKVDWCKIFMVWNNCHSRHGPFIHAHNSPSLCPSLLLPAVLTDNKRTVGCIRYESLK